MSKRLQQSKVSGFFKRIRTEVEDRVATLEDDEVEPVITSLQVETHSTSDSCTSSSTPNTTCTQSIIATVNELKRIKSGPYIKK